MLNYARDHSVADALDYVSVWQAGMLLSDDLIAVARASQTKSKPDFEDLPPPRNLVRLPG